MNEREVAVVPMALAAVSALAGVPAGLVLFAGASESVASAWLEGGWPMYAIVLTGALAALLNGVGVWFAARQAPVVLGVGVFFTVATAAVAGVGFQLDVGSAAAAVVHAAPVDRRLIMFGATAESFHTLLLGHALVAGLFGGLAAALGWAALASPLARRPLALLGVGAGALAAWQALWLLASGGERAAYRGMLEGGADGPTLVLDGLETMHRLQQGASGALVALALTLLLAGTLLRSTPRALAAVVAALLLSVVGVGSARRLARLSPDALALFELRGGEDVSLRPLDGRAVDVKDLEALLTEAGLTRWGGEALAPEDVRDELVLGLAADVTMPRLLGTLRELRTANVKVVHLVGQRDVTLPVPFTPQPPLSAKLTVRTAVSLALPPDWCSGATCDFASLTSAGLRVGAETFALEHRSERAVDRVRLEDAVHLQAEGLTLEQLVDAAHTAAAHDRVLALHLTTPTP